MRLKPILHTATLMQHVASGPRPFSPHGLLIACNKLVPSVYEGLKLYNYCNKCSLARYVIRVYIYLYYFSTGSIYIHVWIIIER